MLTNNQNLNYIVNRQVSYILVAKHKNFKVDVNRFFFFESSVILGFKKISKNFRYFMYFIFCKFFSENAKFGALNTGELFFYSKISTYKFEQLFFQLLL